MAFLQDGDLLYRWSDVSGADLPGSAAARVHLVPGGSVQEKGDCGVLDD